MEAVSGTAPLLWEVVTGQLPAGMNFSSDGVLSGIPSESGSFAFTIRVTDSNGSVAEKSFVMEIALILPPSDIRISKAAQRQFQAGFWIILLSYKIPGM